MREIKFRTWNIHLKVMIYDVQRVYDFCEYVSRPKEWIVEQCTGLKDGDGKDIYEGDILQIDNSSTIEGTTLGPIILYKGMFVSFYGLDVLGRDQFDELYTINNDREVIGNIHENPELL